MPTLFLTGATGFVGAALYPELLGRGAKVRCVTRQLAQARSRAPERDWVYADVDDERSLEAAMRGCDRAYYLVHSMGGRSGAGDDYAEREARGAECFARAAARAGLERIVYLGGVAPAGQASKHLSSRLKTGETLRAGSVPTIELRAAMIVGAQSASWQLVRDLAFRLPLMVLPAWLQNRSQPVAIADVVAALAHAGTEGVAAPGCYSLPGPEVLSGEQVLRKVAALRGLRPRALRVPLLTPRLSSYWLGLVTRGDVKLARELVEGLRTDLIAQEPPYWPLMGSPPLLSLDEAAAAALALEASALPLKTVVAERLIQRLAPWRHVEPPS